MRYAVPASMSLRVADVEPISPAVCGWVARSPDADGSCQMSGISSSRYGSGGLSGAAALVSNGAQQGSWHPKEINFLLLPLCIPALGFREVEGGRSAATRSAVATSCAALLASVPPSVVGTLAALAFGGGVTGDPREAIARGALAASSMSLAAALPCGAFTACRDSLCASNKILGINLSKCDRVRAMPASCKQIHIGSEAR